MKPNPIAAALKGAFSGGNAASAEPTNTPVVLASQSEPEPRPNHGEKDGDGKMPESNALVSDRSRALKEIAERRNAQVQADGNESLPATDDDGQEIESTPSAPEADGTDLDAAPPEQTPDASPPAAAAQPAPVVAAPAGPEEMRQIIVDGQAISVPVSRILEAGTASLQKDAAADLRLKMATQILEDAKRVAAGSGSPASQPPTDLGEMSAADLTQKIQYGTHEEATAAVEYVLKRAGAAPKPEEIVRAAQQAVEPAIAFAEGKKFAQTEYGDLLADPDLGSIFLKRENDARANGDKRGYTELYKAIGDDMRAKFNRPKPGAAATPTPQAPPSTQGRSMAEKQAAKAQAPAAPRLASQRLDGDGAQPRPPTRAEIIDKQRRARGFQPYAAQK